ncbi:MAG: triacylglycerol lipase [Ruminococcus sp.]|nr:triacylglycerol lipase [Ruminococcus sp.]
MKTLFRIIDGLIIAATACLCGGIILFPPLLFYIPLFIILFLLINIVPSPPDFSLKRARLRVCAEGADLLCSFLFASAIVLGLHITSAFYVKDYLPHFVISCVVAFLVLSAVFWNGILRVYFTSVQLGLKYRIIGILCGLIPIANIIALIKIITVCLCEVEFENRKILLNQSRKNDRICKTKYPILLVHGVFFRDSRFLNYWGRIPKELITNGASVYYGDHQSALSVADSAQELYKRIKYIAEDTGCEKVNIIAHSKGGLDCRYAIAHLGADKYIASLTTINTPHKGCLFADYLLKKVPEGAQNTIANAYNSALKNLGDDNPDFLSAVRDLTAESCKHLNETTPDSEAVFYQSVGSRLNRASSGKFPLNFTYHIAKHFDGENDGLVSEKSFPWGEKFTYLKAKGRRGISHGDMVDLNRENIKGFDVREFYVQLVNELRQKGF